GVPLSSAAIDVSPLSAEIGQAVTVTMRVCNNTRGPVSGVRPVLYPPEGPGAVILQSGPAVRPGGCNLDVVPTAAAPAPTAVTSGAGGAATGGGGAAAGEAPSRGPAPEVQLAPYGSG